MSAAPLTTTDTSALTSLGFNISDGIARTAGAITVEVGPHGPHHMRVELTLPNGARLTSFVARTRLASTVGQDASSQR